MRPIPTACIKRSAKIRFLHAASAATCKNLIFAYGPLYQPHVKVNLVKKIKIEKTLAHRWPNPSLPPLSADPCGATPLPPPEPAILRARFAAHRCRRPCSWPHRSSSPSDPPLPPLFVVARSTLRSPSRSPPAAGSTPWKPAVGHTLGAADRTRESPLLPTTPKATRRRPVEGP